jgi:hypothetical protein
VRLLENCLYYRAKIKQILKIERAFSRELFIAGQVLTILQSAGFSLLKNKQCALLKEEHRETPNDRRTTILPYLTYKVN